jgi:hypothetical protein
MTYREPEQVKADYEILMGKELGNAFTFLFAEIHTLHLLIGDHATLFGHSEARIENLNTVAGPFFGRYERIFEREIILCIARLVDPDQQGQYRNLTMHSLMRLAPPPLKDHLLNAMVAVKTETEFAVPWRKLIIAHTDYELAMERPNARQLSESNRKAWRSAARAMGDTLNVIVRHFKDTEIAFTVGMGDDAEDLANWIDFSLRKTPP